MKTYLKRSGFLAVLAATLHSGAVLADTVRAGVGKPLQQAEVLIAQHDYQAALDQVAKARAVGHLSGYETMVTAQIDGIAAAGAGAYTRAAGDYETVLNFGSVSPASRLQYIQAIAGFYDQAQDYPHTALWVNKYIAAGGTDPGTRALLAQAYFQQGDFAHSEQAAQADEDTAQAAGRALPEAELQLLANAADKTGDHNGYETALQDLLKSYPSPQIWDAAIAGVTDAPEFPDRLTLDVDRLRLATGTLTNPGAYEDYTERAILAGDPTEAHDVIERGFSSGILNDQTDGGHAARLRALAAKQAAAAPASPASKLAQAQADQNSVDPDKVLDLGIAFENAGDNAAAAQHFKTLESASLSDPDTALARLWLIYVDDATNTPNGA